MPSYITIPADLFDQIKAALMRQAWSGYKCPHCGKAMPVPPEDAAYKALRSIRELGLVEGDDKKVGDLDS